MIRAAVLVSLGLVSLGGLSGCATAQPDANPGSYTLSRGLVNYDEMRRAKAQCVSVGGEIRPIDDGGDPNQMSNYQCVVPPKGKAQ